MITTFLMYFSWVWVALYALGTGLAIHTWVNLTPAQRLFAKYEPNTIGTFIFIAAVVFLVTFYTQ